MDKIFRHVAFLRYLVVAVPNHRKQLLRSLSREQIQVLSEICLNLLQGNIEITDQDLQSLSKHKNTFRKLAVKSLDNNTKRELMYKDATGIRTLVETFLKHFDGEPESDSSHSDDNSSPEKPIAVKTNIFGANANWSRERFSQADSDTGVSISATRSETAATKSPTGSPVDNRDRRSPRDRGFPERFSKDAGETDSEERTAKQRDCF